MARAAARSSGRELAEGEALPTAGPVALSGLIRFNKPTRNKGSKQWRPLSFEDLTDASSNDAQDFNELGRQDSGVTLGHEGSTHSYSSCAERRDTIGSFSAATEASFHTGLSGYNVPSSTAQAADPTPSPPKDTEILPQTYKDEIVDIFGHRLPDPVFLNEEKGSFDGQIQFIHHPNKDVSVHQWSEPDWQWFNIGLFSYADKKIKGQLANQRLRGQTIGSALPVNSLRYFRALAKQRESDVVQQERTAKTAFASGSAPDPRSGQGDIRQQRPPLQLASQLGDPTHYNSLSAASNFPTLANLPPKEPQKEIKQPTPTRTRTIDFKTLGEDPFVTRPREPSIADSTSASTQKDTVGGVPLTDRSGGTMDFNFRFPPGLSLPNQRNAGQPKASSPERNMEAERRMYFAEQEQNRIQQTLWPQQRQTKVADEDFSGAATAIRVSQASVATAMYQPEPQNPLSRSDTELMHGDRGQTMKEFVSRLGSSARDGEAGPFRTVLHDPYIQPHPVSSYNEQSFLVRGDHATYEDMRPQQPAEYRDGREAVAPGIPQSTTMEVVDPVTTNEPPTPQQFGGPWFEKSGPTQHDPRAHLTTGMTTEEEVSHWWTNGTQYERQDDFFQSIMNTTPLPTNWTPGNRDYDIGRMLIPVYESLAAYTEKVTMTPNSLYWFTPPGKQLIDDSPDGNNSFFGDDKSKSQPPAPTPPRFGLMPQRPAGTPTMTSTSYVPRGPAVPSRFGSLPFRPNLR